MPTLKRNRIPPITDERLAELLTRIKPVVRDNVECGTGKLSYIAPCDPKRVAFPWRPTRTKPAIGLVEVARVDTYHTWGYYGCFKPSLAEVFAAIQDHPDLDLVVAFEVCGPKTATDLNAQIDIVNEGYHRATTILYGRRP